MRILVSGGTGFIGQALCPQLAQDGHDVIVWSRQANPDVAEGIATIQRLEELSGPDPDAVINLAGASIADGRWTEARKRLLVDSRVETTGKLVEWMRAMASPPKALIFGLCRRLLRRAGRPRDHRGHATDVRLYP